MSAWVRRCVVAVLGTVLAVALGGWYLHQMGCAPLEAARLLLGSLLLWGPLGALVYSLLPAAVEHRGSRFALAWGASYALTTMVYFSCAVLGLTFLFYVLQVVALLAAVLLFRRARRAPAGQPATPWGGFDWGLLVLIGLSLVLNVRYQQPFETRENNGQTSYVYLLWTEQLYHVGQAYELSRHIPPHQAMIRGGSPERAYHNFPHITTMLLARYTRQQDMLRAHVFYHYAVIEILFCLCLFGIARTITGSRWPGYAAILFMYVLVSDGTPIKANHAIPYFYFTLFPHATSGLGPVAGTSPQAYSGLTVLCAILLGLALFCKARATHRPLGWLACVLTLLTVATMRFRIHIFLVLFPLCLLGLAVLWKQTRSWLPPTLAAVAVLLSGLLYEEMKGPAYLPETSSLHIGYNGLTAAGSWINEWPLSHTASLWVNDISSDPDIRKWLWQVVSMSGFSLFNVIGLPLLAATVLALRSARIRQEYGWFLFAAVMMTVLSIAGGVLLTMNYDNYSVGGQLLFHTRWYLFALLPIALWIIYRHLRDRWRWPAWGLGAAAVLVVAWTLHVQLTTTPTSWWHLEGRRVVVDAGGNAQCAQSPRNWWSALYVLTSDERLTFYFLHETAPADAVILSNRHLEIPVFPLSGLTGRAAYLEFAGNPIDSLAKHLHPQDDRLKTIKELWALHDPVRFRKLLRQTHATLLLEYADNPLAVEGGRPGLTLVWRSPHQFVSVYRIDP